MTALGGTLASILGSVPFDSLALTPITICVINEVYHKCIF
jgi:hypothetical protein